MQRMRELSEQGHKPRIDNKSDIDNELRASKNNKLVV